MKHLYGYNNEGKEIIFDRRNAKIPHSLVLGIAGTGKTYSVKQEIISNLLYGDREDKIIVVDTDGEYKELAKEYSGEVVDFTDTFINPLDMINYTACVSDMADNLISFVEIILDRECTAYQKSVICETCNSMYGFYALEQAIEKDNVIKRNECPTFEDFYNKLMRFGKEADRLLTAVKPYCTGLFNSFAHKTNVKPDSRLIVIDLSCFSERRMSVALQSVLMYIWSVMMENSYKSAYTWIYLEELHRYLKSTVVTDTLFVIFRRSRMQGGIITGTAQDISGLLKNDTAATILSNTNLILFSQKKTFAEHIKTLYNIPDNFIGYITDRPAGNGLICFENQFVPFSCRKQ